MQNRYAAGSPSAVSPRHTVELGGSGGGDRAAGGLDLLLGAGRELVSGHGDLDADLAVAEHLDREVVPDGTLGHEVVDGHVAALRVEGGELVQVHDLVLHLERVLEAAKLRQPHV